MTLGHLHAAALVNGAIDAAMEDILAKMLTHLKLDADNLTFDALFQRLVDIGLASVTVANMLLAPPLQRLRFGRRGSAHPSRRF